jgi:hypothetical protein
MEEIACPPLEGDRRDDETRLPAETPQIDEKAGIGFDAPFEPKPKSLA